MKTPALAFRSLRQKLFAGMLLTSFVALLVSGSGLFLYDLHSYRQSSANALEVEANLLGYVTSGALEFDDRVVASQNLAFLRARPAIRAAAIYNSRGTPFASYVRQDVPRADVPELPGVEGTSIEGDRLRVFRRIVVEKRIAGTVYLEQDLGIGARVATYAAIVLAFMLASLLVVAALSAWVQRGITRPITHISSLAREVVERRNYAVRADKTTHDEIGTLVDAFNEMLSEIERRTAALERSAAEIGRLNKDLERRVTERTSQLEESNLQLRTANLAKSNFLSMMSHEIRTPMNGVLGMLELLSLGKLDPQQRTTLEIVRESGRTLLRIIDDILDFSKIEAGKLEVTPEAASVSAVVSSVVGIYAGNASSKSLVLKSHVDSRISPAVWVDPLRLQQILNNLVSNAIKFTSKGHVEIRADLVERRDDRDVVRFSVTDTGVGIPPEAKAKLFEPFAQGSAGVARVFGGTGLGLSIGQRLAALMNGSMSIASEPGKGTTVSLTLPLPIADPAELPSAEDRTRQAEPSRVVQGRREPPSVEQAQKEGTLILVVDDHPVNRMLIERQVRALGYAEISASDGREALKLWSSGRFRLVITDCNMPEMDGYELARSIRGIEETTRQERTTIIACTANALKGEAENCYAAGMDDYIAKPIELAMLRQKLDHWLPLTGDAHGSNERAPGRAERKAATSPLDRTILSEVSSGDEAMEREILSEFRRANRQDVASLEKVLAARDLSRIAGAAHRIKGAARSVGATPLAEVCGRIEDAARAGDAATVAACEDEWRAEDQRLEAHLDSLERAAESRGD